MELDEATRIVDELCGRLTKDNKLRFVANGPRGHSTVWSAIGQDDDYYVGSRSNMGTMKISLHALGGKNYRVCRLALDKAYFEKLRSLGLALPADRAFVKWKQPPAPDIGATPAVILVFPTDYMTLNTPPSNYKKPLVTFQCNNPGMAVEVGFFYSREPASILEPKLLEIGKPIFRTELSTGESVSLVMREAPFDPTVIPHSEQFNMTPGYVLDPDFPVGVTMQDLTAALWNAPKDGEPLRIIEISGLTVTRNR